MAWWGEGGGARFSCVRCSVCCRHESGFVYLSEADLAALAAAVNLSRDAFVTVYCRWTPGGRLSLKEKANYDCVFWRDGCAVYAARPLQCRAFPFWPSLTASRTAWEAAARDCPGMNHGSLVPEETVEAWLREQREAVIISR